MLIIVVCYLFLSLYLFLKLYILDEVLETLSASFAGHTFADSTIIVGMLRIRLA